MQLFDRYQGCTVDSNDLPSQIDLGRYYVLKTKEDITNRIINVGTDKIIRQRLLENDNKSLQGVFCQFYHAVNSAEENEFKIPPLIQSVKDKLFLNDFEVMLENKLFHLEEIFLQPHYLLQRTIEKVNVSRAKRIPTKSYQNLASHTEDWLHKSIVNFKPRRILNEELDLLFDVYENQATVAFIERCLLYLSGRIKEVHDISDFIVEYERILADRDDARGWYKKTDRNLALIGDVYEDHNYNIENGRNDILNKTQDRLRQMQKRLKALQGTRVYNEVNKRMVQSLLTEKEINPTNVMANHKHYRYVREMWRELNNVSNEQSDDERGKYEQEVIGGVRNYAKALLTYIIQDVYGYYLSGTYCCWTAKHDRFCEITLRENDDQSLLLNIGGVMITFVIVANDSDEELDFDNNRNLYVLSLGNRKKCGRVINISPYDADSVERVGRVIRENMLRAYIQKLNKIYYYPQRLRDYVKYIKCPKIEFTNTFTYKFNGVPDVNLNPTDIIQQMEKDYNFSRRSRPDRDIIRQEMQDFVNTVNDCATSLFSMIHCQALDCYNQMRRSCVGQLSYLECDCGFVLDSTDGHVLFCNKDARHERLRPEDWGLDYVEFDI